MIEWRAKLDNQGHSSMVIVRPRCQPEATHRHCESVCSSTCLIVCATLACHLESASPPFQTDKG